MSAYRKLLGRDVAALAVNDTRTYVVMEEVNRVIVWLLRHAFNTEQVQNRRSLITLPASIGQQQCRGKPGAAVRFSIGREKPGTSRAFLSREYTEDKDVTLTKLSSGADFEALLILLPCRLVDGGPC